MSSSVKTKILSAYEILAESYSRLIEHKPHNAYYDRPNTLALMPDVAGKTILDAACGPGKYAEILLSKGAEVTGFDLSPKMVGLAQQRNGQNGHFFVHDMAAPLDMFKDSHFDFVLCALALDYIEDWTNTIREFCRVLKPKGYLVLSTQHPFFEYLFFKSDQYFSIEHVKCVWKGFGVPVEVNSYRRSLGEYIAPIVNNGFYIDQLIEPLPTKEFEALDPRHYKELNEFPSFMCIRAVKR
jgi:ubiquinone/menaquinone biosynthesis C-methylase UbiE